MSEVMLQVKNITKDFGPTRALDDVSVTFEKGTVHSLVGRNGAGKSTLVNIIAGLYPQTAGETFLGNEEISGLGITERMAKGIRIVTQHASVIKELSVAENIFLGLWPKKGIKGIDWRHINDLAAKELKDYGLEIDPKTQVKYLNPVEQRKLNIVRALYGGSKLIILDEPTTSLTSKDRSELFDFVVSLKKTGVTFILISHYLEEVLNMSDEITVLRDGKCFTGYKRGSLDSQQLGKLIAGEDIVLTVREYGENSKSKVVLECKDLSGAYFKGVNVSVREGEVLGLVGFPGSGARELCRTLFGLMDSTGTVKVDGKVVHLSHPQNAMKSGIAYIPEDRHQEGLVELLTIRENISLTILKSRLVRYLFINCKIEKKIAKEYLKMLRIKANSIEDKVSSLSGGNQQKVVVAKVLACQPKILILDEPTVGIDVKSREEILDIVNNLTKDGMSVMYLTNDFEELLRVCDRILFFKDGEIVSSCENLKLTPEDVIEIRDRGRVKEGV